ncbi:MAG: hypothetical protein KDB82_13085 [Planctomycetes bacterium]|nr:hypothetical protein [Planctomycetota bacterium]
MRSSFMIFLLGLVLGSTLGIGGIWSQVVQPAYQQINDLEQEHGVMQGALDEAGKTLREVAQELRSEATGSEAPAPLPTGSILPRTSGISPSGIAPSTTTKTTATETTALTSNPNALAERLDKVAAKLDAAKTVEK